MARRSPMSARSRIDPPLRLANVEIAAEAEDAEPATRIEGTDVAALLDVATDIDRLLDPEDISLELEHVADLVAALAHDAESPASGALTVAEHCLRRLAARVDALRPGTHTRAHRFVITPVVREVLKDYTVRLGLLLPEAADVDQVSASSPRMVMSTSASGLFGVSHLSFGVGRPAEQHHGDETGDGAGDTADLKR